MAFKSSIGRLRDLRSFYDLLSCLETAGQQCGLPEVMKRQLPQRGVYFFFEPGEQRSDSGDGSRIVRVGTHALRLGSSSTLLGRLRQHHGSRAGSGNHRGSIFRLLIGDALIRAKRVGTCRSWGVAGQGRIAATKIGIDYAELKKGEQPIEATVSNYLSNMTVAWLDIGDMPSPDSIRGTIECNSIALLSNAGKEAVDPPSSNWLGRHSSRRRILTSGLWNQNHVDEDYDASFLDILARTLPR